MKQFFQRVPYVGHIKPLDDETIKEFKLSRKEIENSNSIHRFNFIDSNKRIAAHYKQQRKFQKTLQV